MADNFHRATRPLHRMAVVTPSDSVDITLEGQERRARALYLGVSGDVTLVMLDDSTVVLTNLAAGVWHPMVFKRINNTGTDPGLAPVAGF